jgi:phosphatidylserine/phosphatidylglycerophosphate/cardiolipin synthase-like enzyme
MARTALPVPSDLASVVPDVVRAPPVGRHLVVGTTCWRIEPADRAAVLIDAAAYFAVAKAAILRARHQILLLGWDFDPRTRFEPDRRQGAVPDTIGRLLRHLVRLRPDLHVHVLKWDMYLPVALRFPTIPLAIRDLFTDRRLSYRLDADHPPGATHHQKILVIDDRIAFCGGMDFAVDRWDTPEHRPDHPARHLPWGSLIPPRHDVAMAVDGRAAAALGDIARARWAGTTGRRLPRPAWVGDPWPPDLRHDLTGVDVGIVRTVPRWSDKTEVREVEALHLRSIRLARRWIYLESQYFAAEGLALALAERLAEPDGPEVVVVCGLEGPDFFDRLAMDPLRDAAVRRIRAADVHGRLRVLAPVAADGKPTIVHSKVTIVDGRILRIGSANLADRSMGFDTECDLAIEAEPGDARVEDAIMRVCHRLWSDHLGTDAATVAATLARSPGLVAAFDAMTRTSGRGVRPVPAASSPILEGVMDALPVVDPARPRGAKRLARVVRLAAVVGTVGVTVWWLTRRRRRSRQRGAVDD